MSSASNRRLDDGTVLSSNTRIAKASGNIDKYKNFGIYRAMLTKIIPKDDPKSISKNRVEYEGVIVGGGREGEILRGIRPLCSFGGKDNFNETVYTVRSEVIKGKDKGDKTPPENTDGSYVIIGFMNGHYNYPIILGGWAQPNNEEYGAVAADGTRLKGQFQNLKWNINNDGKLTITFGDNQIVLDGPNNTIDVTATSKVTINATGDNVEIKSGANTEITASADVKVTASGKVEITGGSTVAISAAALASIIGLGVTLGGGAGPVNMIGSAINVGNSPTEPIVLGDALKALFNSHTHSGVQTGGGSTGTPNSSMGSDQLSSKAKVE